MYLIKISSVESLIFMSQLFYSMFVTACQKARESVYGVIAYTQTTIGKTTQEKATNGTGFMIAPSYVLTASHVIHQDSAVTNPCHINFEVVCIPDIGQNTEKASFIAEDPHRDIALLKIDDPKRNAIIALAQTQIPFGRSIGSLGFPLSGVTYSKGMRQLMLTPRFQGAHISSFLTDATPQGPLDFYETDALMYQGSSGCPGFLPDANVFGMHVRDLISANSQITSNKNKGNTQNTNQNRLAISQWVPSMDLIKFVKTQGVKI